MAFCDIHQHVLWGIDDGPKTAEEMHQMLKADRDNGIEVVVATPHAYAGYEKFKIKLYEKRLREARRYCEENGIDIMLLSGCEIHYASYVPDLLTKGKLPTLGKTRLVLIEFAPDASMRRIDKAADRLYRAGFHPIIAHVERIKCIVKHPDYLETIRNDYGCYVQVNCDTVLKPRLFRERRFIRYALEEELIDVVATDAHDTARRPVRMRETYKKLRSIVGKRYAWELVTLDRISEVMSE